MFKCVLLFQKAVDKNTKTDSLTLSMQYKLHVLLLKFTWLDKCLW